MSWERTPGKPLPTLKDVVEKHNKTMNEADRYTDEEMLTRTTANQFPDNFTILDIIERYEEYVIGYLKDQGKLAETDLKEYQKNTNTPYFRELVPRMEGMVDVAQYKKMIDSMDKLLDDWYAEGFDKGDVLNFLNAIIPEDGSGNIK